MVTGHKDKRHFGQPVDKFRADLDYLTGLGACRQIFIGFALDLTGLAADTFFYILEQVILTH
jgi:hypothetical protein